MVIVMKFGIRKVSPKKRFSNKIKGKGTRSLKRMIIPGYGRKGMGLITNPKKSAYNSIYNKTTVSVDNLFKKCNNSKAEKDQNSVSNILVIFLLICMVIFIFFVFIESDYDKKEESLKKSINEIVEKEKKEKEDYIEQFLDYTNEKHFVEYETVKRFEIMMQKSSNKEIYDRLFSEELKNEISYEQFLSYGINSFALIGTSAMVLADDSIYIGFADNLNHKAYGLKVKEKLIIEFKVI